MVPRAQILMKGQSAIRQDVVTLRGHSSARRGKDAADRPAAPVRAGEKAAPATGVLSALSLLRVRYLMAAPSAVMRKLLPLVARAAIVACALHTHCPERSGHSCVIPDVPTSAPAGCWFYDGAYCSVRKLINPLALAPAPVGAGGAVDIVQGRQLHDVRRCTARYRCRRQDD